MTTVVGIHFKKGSKMYYFDPCGLPLAKGTQVIVETQLGTEYGYCVTGPFEVEDERIVPPLRKVIRVAGDYDKKTLEQIAQKEKQAMEVCRQKVESHGLAMKVVEVDYTFDGNKIIFYFTADGRVDFRELVKDLASVFRTRIELRQIGVRDEARMLGGLGVCGKQFCCSSFLDEFQPVSIKMAKEQNLSLNPTKISGTCGRLMCCLKYEQSAYEHLHSITPRVDSVVQTPHGRGTVTDVSLLRGNIKVRLDSAPDAPLKTLHRTEVKVIKSGRSRADAPDDP
ncbi:MAG: stage 0 sporulation family protein [Oscillospiraceae bacterium]|nr:stage 0 sporulation family protein [Oscillospiraceae bacterium]